MRTALMALTGAVVVMAIAPSAAHAQTAAPQTARTDRAGTAAPARGDVEFGFTTMRVTNKGESSTYGTGFQAGASYRLNTFTSVMGSFSGNYRSETGFTANVYTYAGGARFQAETPRRFRPLAQVTLGSGQDNGTGTGKINHYPVLLPGGGVDVSMSPRFALRFLVDVPLLMHYSDTFVGTRFSVGVVLPMGTR